METLKDFGRGLAASFSPHSLVALGWVYAAVLGAGAAFTLLAFRFVMSSVMSTATAADLRAGQTAAWAIDLIGSPGTQPAVATLSTAAVVLVPVYLVLVIFFSGGVISKVRAALGFAGPERFLTASARHAGAMARVAAVEIVVVGILGVICMIALGAAATSRTHAVAWATLAVALYVLAVVTSAFDYARVAVVARDDGSALGAITGALGFAGRRAPSVLALAALNGVLALAALWAFVWAHSAVALDTGGGVLLGLIVGQVSVIARLWTRMVAYAAETSLWERTAE